MLDDQDHWARNVPTSEFHALGNRKLYYLVNFIKMHPWRDSNGKSIKPSGIIKQIQMDRQYASQIYTIYKKDIEPFTEEFDKQLEIQMKIQNNKTTEPKKEKKPKKKKTENKKENNVVNFLEFKSRKTA